MAINNTSEKSRVGVKTLSTAANAIDMLEGVWNGTLTYWLFTMRKGYSP